MKILAVLFLSVSTIVFTENYDDSVLSPALQHHIISAVKQISTLGKTYLCPEINTEQCKASANPSGDGQLTLAPKSKLMPTVRFEKRGAELKVSVLWKVPLIFRGAK